MSKNRSDNQRLEDLSRGKATARLSRFVVNELDNDFGIDLEVALTEEGAEDIQDVTAQNFHIQLKSSAKFEGDGESKFDIRTSDLKFYVQQQIPVVLALYDESIDTFYWCIVQEYVWDKLERKKPDWRRQKTCRIIVDNDYTFEDLDVLDRSVRAVQKRILRRNHQELDIGEGVAVNAHDFLEIDDQIEADITNFKGHSLLKSRELVKQGEEEKAREIIEEVSQAPRDDAGKVKSLLAKTFFIDPIEPGAANQIIELSEEGTALAEKLDMLSEALYFRVQGEVAKLYIISDRRRKMAIIQNIQKFATYSGDDVLLPLSVQEEELLKDKAAVSAELNDILASLLDENLYREYAMCLTDVIDYISREKMGLAVLEVIDQDSLSDHEHPLVEQAEQLVEVIPEGEEVYNLQKSLALYRHHTRSPDEALIHAEKCVELAEELDDVRLTELSDQLVQKIQEVPDPYDDLPKPDSNSNTQESERALTMEERQEMMEEVVNYLGHDIEDPDSKDDSALKKGIEDADPTEYFQYCEHLRMRYYSTSVLGKATGVHTLGEKVMWCKHGGPISGYELDEMFSEFKQQHCEGCEYHSPRDDGWECTFGWYEDQIEFDEFAGFLSEFEKEHFDT